MIERLLTLEATITPRTQTGPDDEYDTPTWVDGSPTIDNPFYYEPISTEELAQRTGFRATYRGWLLDVAVIAEHSLVTSGSQSWEVEGEPKRFVNPRTAQEFFEVELVKVA